MPVLPLPPKIRAQSSANPRFQVGEHTWGLAESEVTAPSDEVWCEVFDQLRQTDPPCPACHVPDLRLEFVEGFWRDAAFANPEMYEFLEERASATQFGCRPILSCRTGSAICLSARSGGRRTTCAAPSPASAIRHRAGRNPGVSWPRSSGELYPRVGFIVSNLARAAERVVVFYNQRGTAGQWIREGKGAIKWTRLSCRTFAADAVRLQLHVLAYDLGNFMRTLAMPKTAQPWSLTSLREKLIKMGAKVVSHGRYVTFQMAEVAVSRQMFADMLALIARLRAPPAPANDRNGG